jgi:aryl-alcohol dehydrogenase-like predicted oxidoreductase
MTLPRRQLGSSDLSITTVGFGAWAAGGGDWSYGWGPQDDLDSIAAMRRALELGVNWIDTAAVYGLGHSEEVVGRFLAELPIASRPLVFTKGGLVWNDANRMEAPEQTLEPASVRRECEASLKRLGVERIDLYQYHWPDQTGVAIEDSWAEMNRLIDAGKVRYGGVSNFDVNLLERCERVRHVASLQPPFSLIRRDAGSDLIPWCARHRTGVIVYSPMQAGILTDSFSADRVARLTANDWRRGNPNFKSPALEKNIALRNGLVPIAQRLGATVSAVALAWVLGWTGVTGAIVGARAPEQVDGWIGGASLILTTTDLDEISGLITRTSAGKGPTRPG